MNIQAHRPSADGNVVVAHRTSTRLWGAPVALGVLSASGLLSALVSDGWGDTWSWFALGAPVFVMVWCARRR